LFKGTQEDNGIDAAAKGRAAFAKIAPQDVLEVRRLYQLGEITQRELGLLFDLAETQVWAIVNGRCWKGLLTAYDKRCIEARKGKHWKTAA